MEHYQVTLAGVPGSALLTHNERLADPGDAIAKQMKVISSKRVKSEDDHAELARLEYLGGLYLTDDGKPGIPAWNVFRSFQEGAKLNKLGRQVERSIVMTGADIVPIQCPGIGTPEKMYKAGHYDRRSVKVGTSKVMRTRPRFTDWTVTVELFLDTELLDYETFAMVAQNAGQMVGIGDYRPRFGRYEIAEVVEL